MKFHTSCKVGDSEVVIEEDIEFKSNENIEELTYIILGKYNLFEQYFTEIYDKLNESFHQGNRKIYNEKSSEFIRKFKAMEFDEDSIVRSWSEKFDTKTVKFASEIPNFDDLLNFCDKFNILIDGSTQKGLVNLIMGYRIATSNQMIQKKVLINGIVERYAPQPNLTTNPMEPDSIEMNYDVQTKINTEKESIEKNYENVLKDLHRTQRKEFRELVIKTPHESNILSINDKNLNSKPLTNSSMVYQPSLHNSIVDPRYDSYSVKFGYQLKCSHNINISCKPLNHFVSLPLDNVFCEHLILQNILSLYSQNLHAVIMLTDDNMPSNTPDEQFLFQECSIYTELHFETISSQINTIKEKMKASGIEKLSVGDFYVTIHSNLSMANIIFHLCAKMDELDNMDPSLNHPLINGLHNIIEVCFTNRISTITFPLFLISKIQAKHDLKWCSTRSDSMLKCLKSIIIQSTPFHLPPRICSFNLLLPENSPNEIFDFVCSLVQQNYTQLGILNLNTS